MGPLTDPWGPQQSGDKLLLDMQYNYKCMFVSTYLKSLVYTWIHVYVCVCVPIILRVYYNIVVDVVNVFLHCYHSYDSNGVSVIKNGSQRQRIRWRSYRVLIKCCMYIIDCCTPLINVITDRQCWRLNKNTLNYSNHGNNELAVTIIITMATTKKKRSTTVVNCKTNNLFILSNTIVHSYVCMLVRMYVCIYYNVCMYVCMFGWNKQ